MVIKRNGIKVETYYRTRNGSGEAWLQAYNIVRRTVVDPDVMALYLAFLKNRYFSVDTLIGNLYIKYYPEGNNEENP